MAEYQSEPGAISRQATWPGFQFNGYRFKVADPPEEMEQIHVLVYRTFVVEIRQHPDPGTGRLVDKFHHKNTYIVATQDGRVYGMLAVHDQPPFSVADALPSPEPLERLCPKLLEARLLAIDSAKRHQRLFLGLIWALYDFASRGDYQYVAISGLLERQRMYKRMGFQPLGPPVQRGQAMFVPMLLDLSNLPVATRQDLARLHVDGFKSGEPYISGES